MKRHRKRDRATANLEIAAAVADTAAKTPEAIAAGLRDEISQMLRALERISEPVTDLRDSHQATSGYVTGEDKRAQGQAHARDLRDHAIRLKDGQPVGPGESPSPGNIAAISADAQIWFTIRHQIRVLTKHVVKTTALPLPYSVPGEHAPIGDLVWHLNLIIGQVDDTKLLAAALRDLTRAHDTAERLVDGDDARLMDKPCPWCGNRSLRLDQARGVITCDRDPRQASQCVCKNTFCTCHQNPAKHRHTWHRDRDGAKPDSWWGLIDQQNEAARDLSRRHMGTPNPDGQESAR